MSTINPIRICITDDSCPRHGKFIYYCSCCHNEWLIRQGKKPEAMGKYHDFSCGICPRDGVIS